MSEKWMDDLAEIVHVKCHASVDSLKADLTAERDKLNMVHAVLETWATSGPMHPAAARLWHAVSQAARGAFQ